MKADEQNDAIPNDALTTLLNQAEETKRTFDEAAQRQQKFNQEKTDLEAQKLREEQNRALLQTADSKQGTKSLYENALGTKTERAFNTASKQEAKALQQQQKTDEELEKKVTGLHNAFAKVTSEQKKQHPELIAKVIATGKGKMIIPNNTQSFSEILLTDQDLLVAMDTNGKTTYDYLIEQKDTASINAAKQVKTALLTDTEENKKTCTQICINALAAGDTARATEFSTNTYSAYVDKQDKSFLEHLVESKGDFSAKIHEVITGLDSTNTDQKKILNKGFAAAVKAKNSAYLDLFTADKVDLEAKLFDNDKTALEHAVSDQSKKGIATTKKLIGLYKAKIDDLQTTRTRTSTSTIIGNEDEELAVSPPTEEEKQLHKAYLNAFETAITAKPASPELIKEFTIPESEDMFKVVAEKGTKGAVETFLSQAVPQDELKKLSKIFSEDGTKTIPENLKPLLTIACENGNVDFLQVMATKMGLDESQYEALLTDEQQQTLKITKLCEQGDVGALKKLAAEKGIAEKDFETHFLKAPQLEKLNAALEAQEKEEDRKKQEAKERADIEAEIRRAAGQESSIDPTQQGEQRKWIGSSMVNKQKIIGDPDKAHLLEMPVADQHGKFEYKITNNQAPNDVGTQTMRIPRKGSTPPSWDMIQFDNETGAIIKHYVQDKAGHIYTREDMEAANSLGTSKIGPQTMGIIEALHSGAAVEIEPQKTPAKEQQKVPPAQQIAAVDPTQQQTPTTDLTPPPKEPLKRSQSSPNLRDTLQGNSLSGNILPTIGKADHNNTIHNR